MILKKEDKYKKTKIETHMYAQSMDCANPYFAPNIIIYIIINNYIYNYTLKAYYYLRVHKF